MRRQGLGPKSDTGSSVSCPQTGHVVRPSVPGTATANSSAMYVAGPTADPHRRPREVLGPPDVGGADPWDRPRRRGHVAGDELERRAAQEGRHEHDLDVAVLVDGDRIHDAEVADADPRVLGIGHGLDRGAQLVDVDRDGAHAATILWWLRPQTPSPCGSLALRRPGVVRSLRSLTPPPGRARRAPMRCRATNRRPWPAGAASRGRGS